MPLPTRSSLHLHEGTITNVSALSLVDLVISSVMTGPDLQYMWSTLDLGQDGRNDLMIISLEAHPMNDPQTFCSQIVRDNGT